MDIKSAIAELETKQPLPSPNGTVSDITFGVPELDSVVGKLPRGKIIEIYGEESSGKTTLLLNLVKNNQKHNLCAWIDTEFSFEGFYAQEIGCDLNMLFISHESRIDKLFELIQTLIKHKIDIIVVDSLAGISSDGDDYKHNKLLKEKLRSIQNNHSVIIFTNQIRDNLNYYSKENARPCKNSIEIYSSLILELKRLSKTKKLTNIKVIKNKFGKINQEVIIKL